MIAQVLLIALIAQVSQAKPRPTNCVFFCDQPQATGYGYPNYGGASNGNLVAVPPRYNSAPAMPGYGGMQQQPHMLPQQQGLNTELVEPQSHGLEAMFFHTAASSSSSSASHGILRMPLVSSQPRIEPQRIRYPSRPCDGYYQDPCV